MVPSPLFFRERYRQIVIVWFFVCVTKILLANFWKKFQEFSSLQGVNVNLQFFRLLKHISEIFQYFFNEIYMVARLYQFLAVYIKSLLISSLYILNSRLKSRFGPFFHIFKLSILLQVFDLGQWFFLWNFSPIYVLVCSKKDLFIRVTIEPTINTTQTRSLKNFARYALWSSPCKMPISVLLIRKTWKLVSV